MPQSWVPVPAKSHFSIANIPFGIITTSSAPNPRAATIIGDHVLDLGTFASRGGFASLQSDKDLENIFNQPNLNAFAACGRAEHRAVRKYLQEILDIDTTKPDVLKNKENLKQDVLLPYNSVTNHLPLSIGDYTDFFAGINHAFNVGTMFRGPDNALQPNYKHLPVGYHGRSSSVVVSGTDIRRPRGQILLDPKAEPKVPTFSPSRRLDIELELGAFLCKESNMGDNVPIDEAEEYIFGFVLLNDWSARDIQTWEYVPLGPFNAKNFGTTISPWVVLTDALEPFRCSGIENNTQLQSYLREGRKDNMYDIALEVDLITPSGHATTISRTSSRYLLWSMPQMIAHHSISGCPMKVGDLLGSGTISGSEPGSYGSLLETCQGGKVDIKLEGSGTRKFLQDGDTIVIRGCCGDDSDRLVGFGTCVGKVLPALSA